VLRVTPHTSLQLRGRTAELPRSDFNRQDIRYTRHTDVAQKNQRCLSAEIEKDNLGSFEESPHGLSSTSERLVLIWAFLLLPPHPEESGRHPVRFPATLYRFANDLNFAQVALPEAPIP